MKILNELSDLTQFVHDEFSKIQQAYGLLKMSDKDISKITRTVLTSFKLANLTRKKKLRYYARIDWAIFTAPHSWLWRFFHKKLWAKCLEEIELRKKEEQEAKEPKEELEPLPPLKQPVDLSALSLESTISPAERLLNNIE